MLKTMVNPQQLKLVIKTVNQIAKLKNKKLTVSESKLIAEIALKPPVWVSNSENWLDVVCRGLHKNYGGAVMHYRASEAKWQDELNELVRDNGLAVAQAA